MSSNATPITPPLYDAEGNLNLKVTIGQLIWALPPLGVISTIANKLLERPNLTPHTRAQLEPILDKTCPF
jgi:hypothetical protein